MKQHFKLLTLAVALVAGLTTMTSCLNGDSDSSGYASPVVKVYTTYLGMGVYFETIDGKRIEPSEASYNASISQGMKWNEYNGQIIQLQYTYDPESPDVEITDDGISGVTLVSFMPMNSPVEVVQSAGASNDSISNMPIISIGEESYNGTPIESQYWDERTLFVPINYYIGNFNQLHSFTLEYRPYETALSDGTLRLYLEHNKQEDNPSQQNTSLNYAGYGYSFLYYRAFDLSPVENYLSMQGQSMPTSVTIVAREDDYSIDLTDTTPTQEYVVTYEAEQ